MRSSDALLLKDTNAFNFVVVSNDGNAKQLLFPKDHERLGKFKNIKLVRNFSELLQVYDSSRDKKLVVFVDVTTQDLLPKLDEMIYSIHAERRGIFFGFISGRIADGVFDQLISLGFDDVFELNDDDEKKFMRMYSWIRRFGGNTILSKDTIPYLSEKCKRIGKWNVFTNEMVARDNSGKEVKLTRQEADFLTLLASDEELNVNGTSYSRLFKAPHAIAHNLRKKLGENLPILHGSGGRYYLANDSE
jgi:hypothetical protein